MKNLTLLKNNLLQKKRQRGLTLVEVGLAVLISAIIIIGVMYMYQSSSTNSDIYQLNNDITSIRAAASTAYQATNTPPQNITALISGGYLVLGNSTDGTGANPWGGNYTFTSDSTTTTTTYQIGVSALPTAVCQRTLDQWSAHGGSSGTCTGSGGTRDFSITFTYQ